MNRQYFFALVNFSQILKFEGWLSRDVLKFMSDDFDVFTVMLIAKQIFKVKNFTEGNPRKTAISGS